MFIKRNLTEVSYHNRLKVLSLESKYSRTMYTIKELEDSMPQVGLVEWIGIRTERKGFVKELSEVEAVENQGLDEDHYSGKPGSQRQVTLIQSEHLPVVANIMKINAVDPALLRRNIVVSSTN